MGSGTDARPPDAQPSATVVIPVHNGGHTLATQLDAVTAQLADLAFDVIVVDNNSTDETPVVAASYARDVPALRVVAARDGASVAYARNAGAREATTETVLFCDADDVVRPGWVAAMVRGLAEHDIVGGRLDVTRINSPAVQAWTEHPPGDALPTAMKWRPYATGANLGVRRQVWADLGGFDESFEGGHEEVDFAWRALDRGRTIAFVPDAVVDYRLRSDRRAICRQRFHYGRTYAQLYSRFRDAPIPRVSRRHELKVILLFLAELPREWRSGHLTRWLAGLAWTVGRYRGDLAYRVRCPL
jgi:GT2 family glycosyltransferase